MMIIQDLKLTTYVFSESKDVKARAMRQQELVDKSKKGFLEYLETRFLYC